MIVLTETVSEDLTSKVIEIMGQSPIGAAIICVVGLVVILIPILLPVAKEWKSHIIEKKAAIKAEEERKEKEAIDKAKKEQKAEEFQRRLEDMLESLPKIGEQVQTLSNEVNSLRELKEDWNNLSTNLETRVDNLSKDVLEMKEQSMNGDLAIQEKLTETTNIVQSLSETTDKIKINVGTIIEGDLNTFRVYISQLYNRYVVIGNPFPRSVKQELRVRFETYEKEGGNSWARGMYNELMTLPVVHDDYIYIAENEENKKEDDNN